VKGGFAGEDRTPPSLIFGAVCGHENRVGGASRL